MIRYQAFHAPGEYPPSPIFDTNEQCEEWVRGACIDGHNKGAPCDGCLLEWLIEEVLG